MSDHARLSASAAHRWMECPASPNLSEGVPHTESPYASLGTMAHSVAAYCLRYEMDAREILDDYAEPVQFYLDFCRQYKGGIAESDLTPYLKTLDPDLGGTADYIAWDTPHNELVVVDFKFGTGVTVDAEDNYQLMMYALGALLSSEKKSKTVRVVIVQPRLENPDAWIQRHVFKSFDLLDFAARVVAAARATRAAAPLLNPGVEQCRWCPAALAKRCDAAVRVSSRRPAGVRVKVEDFAVVAGTADKNEVYPPASKGVK